MGRQPKTKMRYTGAVSIGRLAQNVTAPIFSRHGMGHGEIAHAWREIVGDEMAAFCQPERLTASRANTPATLVVRVFGARAVEVHYASLAIIEGVNSLYGYQAVERIKVVQARPDARPQTAARQAPTTGAEPAPAAGVPGIASTSLSAALSRMERGLAAREEH